MGANEQCVSDEEELCVEPITDAEIDEHLKVPVWLDDALGRIPLEGNLLDVIDYIKMRPELHGGAPFKYLTRHSRDILLRLERRRRAQKEQQRNDIEWIYPMNEIDRLEQCPDEVDGLVEWD